MRAKPGGAAHRRGSISSSVRVAVIGAGLAGLSCALHLAEAGCRVDVYEAAPAAGGRTRSFFDARVGQWVDNGPHLLIGAYARTQALLQTIGAEDHVTWQPSLRLGLWDRMRGFFQLAPMRFLPLSLALPLAIAAMPGQGPIGALASLRLGWAVRRLQEEKLEVRSWLEDLAIPAPLCRDLLEPMCLGAMNEAPETANALSFARVLREAFATHATARLGWFNRPLSQGLIAPLLRHLEALGARVLTRRRVERLSSDGKDVRLKLSRAISKRYPYVVLTTPAHISNALLGTPGPTSTRAICNIHLWFPQPVHLPAPIVGGIGTEGQWFFDISQQMHHSTAPYHVCAVISADTHNTDAATRIQRIHRELEAISGRQLAAPKHVRVVRTLHATVQVRRHPPFTPPPGVIDASERPQPGELPATIEYAVRRGEQAATRLLANFRR